MKSRVSFLLTGSDAKQIDVAGNASACSPVAVVYIEDSVPPQPPIVLGISPSAVANDNTPLVLGIAEPQASIKVFTNGACLGAPAGTGAADAMGSYAVTVTVADNSVTTFYAQALDAAGNVSPCSSTSATFTEDSLPPAPPVIATTIPVSPSNSNTTPAVQGTAEPNSTVRIYSTADCSGVPIGNGSAGGDGHFFITVTVPANAATTLYATATDASQNSSSCSVEGLTYVHDDIPPSFSGGSRVDISRTQLSLRWPSASDNISAPSEITYEICRSTVQNACYQFQPTIVTPPGATMWNIGDVDPSHSNYFLIRARDAAGNIDNNVNLVFGGHAPANGNFSGPPSLLSAGMRHTCAVRLYGNGIYCWGNNYWGELGPGVTVDHAPSPLPLAIVGARGIGGGGDFSCALVGSGVSCWGDRAFGVLGDGTASPDNVAQPTPVAVTMLTNVAAVAVGGVHNCALLVDGTVSCWGLDEAGQLGDGDTISKGSPVVASGVTNVVDLFAGSEQTCALLGDKTVKCWGDNLFGEVGMGAVTQTGQTPVTVTGLSNVIALGTGSNAYHTCAIVSDGTSWCWGANDAGQLGHGPGPSSPTPVAVSGLAGAVALALGASHTCALLADGTVRCWGSNQGGMLGLDQSVQFASTPTKVRGVANAVAIASGSAYTCALLIDGSILCWGNNADGQLGDGTTEIRYSPVIVVPF
jgi:alpha-tubulin suppressor-like RCC1 family protein